MLCAGTARRNRVPAHMRILRIMCIMRMMHMALRNRRAAQRRHTCANRNAAAAVSVTRIALQIPH